MDMTIDVTDFDRYIVYDVTKINMGGRSNEGMPYDSTNGTKSAGDIHRWGNSTPLPSFDGRPLKWTQQ